LSDKLTECGFNVTLLRGETSIAALPRRAQRIHLFSTLASLEELLQVISRQGPVHAVLHAAALGDFGLRRLEDVNGRPVNARKIPSGLPELRVILQPLPKLIKKLPALFPGARIVGWKYELDGTQDDAKKKAWEQIADNGTHACVLNGNAYGKGFGFCQAPEQCHHVDTREALAQELASWLMTS
jgi:phosphopantothenoylcysteine decarboxylase/phosphopantothenate--cysteine ligase